MIVITGAGGKTGRAILHALAALGEKNVRAWVRRDEQAEEAQTMGAAEVVVGDLKDPQVLEKALRGASVLYHIAPNMYPDELALGRQVIAAGRAAGLKRIVYHSVLHPQVQAMQHHWNKLLVEERLFESGLDFTILQPAAYMQNVLAGWKAIREKGIYSVPYAAETRLGMVDLEDVAAVAARVLSEDGHAGAIYELSGSEALSQTEVAEALTKAIGRPVQVEVTPRDQWEQRARAGGMADYAVTTLRKMFEYYENFGFWGNSRVLAGLLGREPVKFAQFAARAAQEN